MAYNRYGNYYRPSFFGGFSFFPPVIKSLLIANAAVFVGMMFLSSFRIGPYYVEELVYHLFALMPLGHGFMVWQLFTYMFIHAGFTHMLFNMLALWMFGMELENSLGSKKFLIFYLLCGLGGGIVNLLVAPLFTDVGPTVGASGAVYGVLLAFGMMFPDRLIFIYFLLPIKAKYFVFIYMALEIVSVGSTDGIAHFAHLGGALVAFVYLISDGYRFSFMRDRPQQTIFTKSSMFGGSTFSRPDIPEANVYEINEQKTKKSEATATQQEIDQILDKISRAGYQSLSAEEKRILFEASKKLN